MDWAVACLVSRVGHKKLIKKFKIKRIKRKGLEYF